jgi:hypothetical protein
MLLTTSPGFDALCAGIFSTAGTTMVKSYAQKFDPAVVIDVATLTGAVIMALGKHHSGVMANDQSLADDLMRQVLKKYHRYQKLPPYPPKQSVWRYPCLDNSS